LMVLFSLLFSSRERGYHGMQVYAASREEKEHS
jgi:hypothetical protein